MQTIRSPVAVVRSALLVKRSLADKKYGYKSKIRVERDNDRIPKSFFEFAVDHVRTEVFEKKYRGMLSDPYRHAEDRADAYPPFFASFLLNMCVCRQNVIVCCSPIFIFCVFGVLFSCVFLIYETNTLTPKTKHSHKKQNTHTHTHVHIHANTLN